MDNMETPPVRRVSRPTPRQRKPVNAILPTLVIAILLATLFSLLSPNSFSTISLSDKLAYLLTPQAASNPVNPLNRPCGSGSFPGIEATIQAQSAPMPTAMSL